MGQITTEKEILKTEDYEAVREYIKRKELDNSFLMKADKRFELEFEQTITIDLDSSIKIYIIEDGEKYIFQEYIRRIAHQEALAIRW